MISTVKGTYSTYTVHSTQYTVRWNALWDCAQYSTAQRSTFQYSTAPYNTVCVLYILCSTQYVLLIMKNSAPMTLEAAEANRSPTTHSTATIHSTYTVHNYHHLPLTFNSQLARYACTLRRTTLHTYHTLSHRRHHHRCAPSTEGRGGKKERKEKICFSIAGNRVIVRLSTHIGVVAG